MSDELGNKKAKDVFPNTAGILGIDGEKTMKELFPAPKGKAKPGNSIENAIVTMDEKDYNRLREIETQVKDLFFLARTKSALVGLGRPKREDTFKEHDIVKKLRELTGM